MTMYDAPDPNAEADAEVEAPVLEDHATDESDDSEAEATSEDDPAVAVLENKEAAATEE